MNKTTRLQLIKNLWNSRNLSCVVAPSKTDEDEEKSLIHEDDGRLEQEREAFPPSKELICSFERENQKESDCLLTHKEKQILRDEIIRAKIRKDLDWRNPFALILMG